MDFHFTIPRYTMSEYFPDVPVLFSAGSYYLNNKIRTPLYTDRVSNIIVDCGSYSLASRFGCFPFTWENYLNWIEDIKPKWFALWDCIGDSYITQKYIDLQRDSGGVPTCQGVSPQQYRQQAKDLKDFKLIGVGNLVNATRIDLILDAILSELPDVELHLWGVGLGKLKKIKQFYKNIVSVDSSNWMGRWGRGIERYKDGKKQYGYTQKEFAIKIMLLEYNEKFKKWNRKPKQIGLF